MYRSVFVALSLVLALVAPAAPATAAPPEPARGAALQALLEAEHAAGMPGLYAVVRDGHSSWGVAAGTADVRTGTPPRPWFRHRVGSITKTFVATTVLQLVGAGRLRLDAPIGTYLPDLVPGDVGRQVTVRMLLQHTSGIGNYTDTVEPTIEGLEALRKRTVTPEELVAQGLALPPTNTPGAGWSYSNTNFVILGLLVERVTRHSMESEVGRRILRPLGMRGTYFPGTDLYIRGPHDHAYIPEQNGALHDFTVFNMSWAWAAGALISTPSDLNHFYRALLTGKLLSPGLLAQMETTVPVDPAHPEAGGYGLGLFWLQLPCGRFWGHNGAVIGQSTVSLHSIDGRRQVTLAENLNNYPVPSPIDDARNAFLIEALCGPGASRTARLPGMITG
jgi:D-alanyl-D-alanine carboxypeptidase